MRGIVTRLAERIDSVPLGQSCLLTAGGRAPAAREMLTQAGESLPKAPEALALLHGRLAGRASLLIGGSDSRSLTYALLEAADRVACAHNPVETLELPELRTGLKLLKKQLGFRYLMDLIPWTPRW